MHTLEDQIQLQCWSILSNINELQKPHIGLQNKWLTIRFIMITSFTLVCRRQIDLLYLSHIFPSRGAQGILRTEQWQISGCILANNFYILVMYSVVWSWSCLACFDWNIWIISSVWQLYCQFLQLCKDFNSNGIISTCIRHPAQGKWLKILLVENIFELYDVSPSYSVGFFIILMVVLNLFYDYSK